MAGKLCAHIAVIATKNCVNLWWIAFRGTSTKINATRLHLEYGIFHARLEISPTMILNFLRVWCSLSRVAWADGRERAPKQNTQIGSCDGG